MFTETEELLQNLIEEVDYFLTSFNELSLFQAPTIRASVKAYSEPESRVPWPI